MMKLHLNSQTMKLLEFSLGLNILMLIIKSMGKQSIQMFYFQLFPKDSVLILDYIGYQVILKVIKANISFIFRKIENTWIAPLRKISL